MGKPLATVEYCYVNNFEVRHESYYGTAPNPSEESKGAPIPVKLYRVFANFQYDLLDAKKILINRTSSRLTLRDGLASDATAAQLLEIVSESTQLIKDHIAAIKADKSGFVA